MQKSYLLFLFALVLLLSILKTFSSGNPFVGRKTEVNFWNGWTGPDGTAMLDVIRQFNKENPDIIVSMQRMDWATYYNKLMVSSMSGRGPQVFVIHASTLPRMVRAGFVGEIGDIYGAKTSILKSDFEPKVLEQVIFNGKTVAVPLDIHPQGLYCNADLLKEAGFKNPDGTARLPKNRQEFIDTIRATQKVDHDGTHSIWGFSWTVWGNNFMSLMPQFGGHCFDSAGNPDLANPSNVRALNFMGDLMNKQKLTPPAENSLGWLGFRQKHVAMVWEGVYMVGDLQTLENFNYVGGQIPQIGDRRGTMGDSHCLCVRSDLTPKEREASERFIAYLSNHSIEWAKAGQVPARISIRKSDAFRKMQVQYAFSKEVPYVVYPPRTPLLFELTDEVNLAVEKVLRGRATAFEALTVANTHLVEAEKRDKEGSS